MGAIESHHIYGLQVRESADDGSDFTNPDADYRIVFLGEDGLLHAKDSAGTVTSLGGTGLTDPMTTRGDMIVRNASNVTARLARGSADTYLGSDGTDLAFSAVTDAKLSTSDITTNNASTTKHGFLKKLSNVATEYMDGTGAWSTPAGGGGGGALVLLEQHTASSSATLDFTTAFSATYDEYVFELLGLIPATNAVDLVLLMSTDGGSTYDSGGNYTYTDWRYVPGGAAQSGADQSSIPLCNGSVDHVSNNSSWGVVGRITLFYPGDTTLYKRVIGQTSWLNSGGIFEGVEVRGAYKNATAVNAVRFFFNSGNIASGTIRCYGIAKT
jgi:hypothetical protein